MSPVVVTLPTIREAVETSPMQNTQIQIEEILPDELKVVLPDVKSLWE